MKNIIKITFVLIGTLIGAGFVSGKELYNFFYIYEFNRIYWFNTINVNYFNSNIQNSKYLTQK